MEHDRNFIGVIGRTVADSTPSWAGRPTRLAKSPNIVMIVLDDVGYAQLGCYGSDIETSALDSLAADGLRYANFHVTPLCSPTRACLLTGRNHHAVGVGRVAEMRNGFPNTRGFVAREAANLAEILRPHGYQTLAAGKWHLAPIDDASPAGPYDHWPMQRGFDRFYGFLSGETNQWNPELVVGNERIDLPPAEGYHLSAGIVDQSCKWLRQLVSAAPEKPFFLYLAFAAGHSPHHVPPAFADKYRGRFDDGWDAARDRILARQKASGLLPADQRLAPRNPGVQVWDDMSAEEKMVAARFEEVFAGFLDHADVQIGRLLKQLDDLGKRDDTIVVAISDNGAAPLGGPYGSYDHHRSRGGDRPSVGGEQGPPRRPGRSALLRHLPLRVGHGGQHAVQALQEPDLCGWHPRAPANPLARWNQSKGRDSSAVLPRCGCDPDAVGLIGRRATRPCQRRRADAAARNVHGPHLKRQRRGHVEENPVLRDRGSAGDLAGGAGRP